MSCRKILMKNMQLHARNITPKKCPSKLNLSTKQQQQWRQLDRCVSPLEYRPCDFAVRPARILEQKRDCSQSKSVGANCSILSLYVDAFRAANS